MIEGMRGEGFEGRWHFTCVSGDERGAHGSEVFGLVAVEAGGADDGFEFFLRYGSVVFGCAAALKEIFRDKVHSFVRALRGEDRGNQKLQRVRGVELTVGIGVDLREPC
jgi:hypothetical protein